MNNDITSLAVVGLGYVGLPVAAAFADSGLQVVGIDIKWDLVKKVNRGENPIKGKEPGLDELVSRVVENGMLTVTDDFAVVQDSDYILVAIDTPFDKKMNRPDLRGLEAVMRSIGKHLRKGSMVVIESTVAPGTCEGVLLPILEKKSGLKGGVDFDLVHCPERLRVGRLLLQLRTMNRVVGSLTPEGAERAIRLYSRIVEEDLDPSDLVTAELVKTAENAYRDVNIAFANEVALIAQEMGADAFEVRRLVNKCPWRDMHVPGAGVGGHCLTKDGLLLRSSVEATLGSVIMEARWINDHMPEEMMRLLLKGFRDHGVEPEGATVVVLGLSFLEESDDTREAPTFIFLEQCKEKMIGYRVVDPFVESNEDIEVFPLTPATFEGADALVLMTRHSAFVNYDYAQVIEKMAHPIAVDGRDGFHREYTALGFHYYGLGKTPTRP